MEGLTNGDAPLMSPDGAAATPEPTAGASDIRALNEEIRKEMSHQVLPTEQWPLFDIRATHIDRQRTRLHISLDILITDGMGLMILFREWFQLYQQPTLKLTPLSLSFRDYVLTKQKLRETSLLVFFF